MDASAGTVLAVINFIIILGGLTFAGYFGAKTDGEGRYLWQIAKMVVLYIPISLGMFTVFAAMFFENTKIIVGLLVGMVAIILNYLLDGLVFRGGLSQLANGLSGIKSLFGRVSSSV